MRNLELDNYRKVEQVVVFQFIIELQNSKFTASYKCTVCSSRIPVAGGDLNLDRSLFGLVTIGTAESQKLIAIGGYGTMGYLDDSEEWNDVTQKWKSTTRYSLYRKRRSFGYLLVAASSVCSE